MLKLASLLVLVAFAGCSKAVPSKPLHPGYYGLQTNWLTARLIVEPNTRTISYDVWHVSKFDEGSVVHVHYDLIGKSPAPQTGVYDVTQDGNDCGQVTIEPYTENGKTIDGIVIMHAGYSSVPFGGGRVGSDAQYNETDHGYSQFVVGAVMVTPGLYNQLRDEDRYMMDDLTPQCNP